MAKMKPIGKRGLVAVQRLGRNYKTGGFNAISNAVEKEYLNKVGSKKAEEIGKKVAGKIYWEAVAKRKNK